MYTCIAFITFFLLTTTLFLSLKPMSEKDGLFFFLSFLLTLLLYFYFLASVTRLRSGCRFGGGDVSVWLRFSWVQVLVECDSLVCVNRWIGRWWVVVAVDVRRRGLGLGWRQVEVVWDGWVRWTRAIVRVGYWRNLFPFF